MVISGRSGQQDQVSCLRSGADDYLIKPFGLLELAARLEARLRRPGHLFGTSLQIANLKFDTLTRQASIDDQPQILTSREASVLEQLMLSKGCVVSKSFFTKNIFGASADVTPNAIEVYVHRLRKQLTENGADVRIQTVRGVGYLLTNADEDANEGQKKLLSLRTRRAMKTFSIAAFLLLGVLDTRAQTVGEGGHRTETRRVL